ncbi:polysaccharide biosynthesis protein [Paenibacillus paridis]|uniref:polysaccharide biosynthesis protein n=1 Tax=Paenibacillus paridis TaxID=2583376 RepID=UPI001390EF01|nr:nucleoside-diphosphate sugar epimerase/dehydratase [Paenibacillus paridis]
MTYRRRMLVLSIIDNMLLVGSWLYAFFLIYDGLPLWSLNAVDYVLAGSFIAMSYFFLVVSKSYKTLWKYAGILELLGVLKSITLSTALYAVLLVFFAESRFSASMLIVLALASMVLLGGIRLAAMKPQEHSPALKPSKKKALIVGAGAAGTIAAKYLLLHDVAGLSPFGFIDDNDKKQNYEIYGIRVLGKTSDIPRLVSTHGITDILIAIPSAESGELSRITSICKQTPAEVRILPRMQDMLLGRHAGGKVNEIDVKELLGREMINDSLIDAQSYIKGNIVLITGAGGSIGGELVNQVAKCAPESIILLGHGENSIHLIEGIMRERYPALRITSVIADIQNPIEVEHVFHRHQPSIVFHAAAHKHVPLMENNPSAAVRNNVFGTMNVAEQAVKSGVQRFVCISTDKAVEPVNVMGMTKRLAEMIVQMKSKHSATTFSIVRFGNVLESRGSVIPIFKKQIAAGGPVTVTHPEMVRYFMTIPEAVHLVLQAGALSKGGEIFVLDMGKPVKIVDLAKALIRFAGYEPEKEMKIVFTGMRPGEKLSESLFYEKEKILPSQHPRIFIASPRKIDEGQLQADIQKLKDALIQEPDHVKEILGSLLRKYGSDRDESGDAL